VEAVSEVDVDAIEARMVEFRRFGMSAVESSLIEVDLPALVVEVQMLRRSLGRLRARYDLCGDCAARAQATEYAEEREP
jgi:hypothetical protein